ncbi:MAG TPA: hypothetical protein QGF58_23875 [Myxococcota bacterium]|nr:hypothetical protein [Myxococcota bacterium]
MKREFPVAVAAALGLAALLLHPALYGLGEVLPGEARAYGQAWGAWSLFHEAEVAGEVVLAGWPVLVTIALLDLLLPLAVATTLAVWAWLAAGLAAVYLCARSRDAPLPGALAAALVAGANPALLQGVHEGRYEWLVVPWVALALFQKRPLWTMVGLLGAAAHSPLFGLVTALLAATVAVTVSYKRAGATLAAGGLCAGLAALPYRELRRLPVEEQSLEAFANAGDLLEPFYSWRPDAAAPGIALWLALAGAAWLLAKRRLDVALAVAALLGIVLALGPELWWGRTGFRLHERPVPLPAALIEAMLPSLPTLTWKAAMVPAMVAAGLLLGPLRRPGFGVAALVLGFALSRSLPTSDASIPRSVEQLADGDAPVLHLPVATDSHNLRLLWFQTAHARPLFTGMGPLEASELLADPLVVLALNATAQEPRYAVPDRYPRTILMTLGVREVLLHRDGAELGGLVLLDQLLGGQLGSPQRDLVGEVDVYRIPAGHGGEEPLAVPVQEPGDPPEGWLAPERWLETYGGG